MKQPLITIIDYGIGNTQSIMNAISFLGYRKLRISNQPNQISSSDILILPGVGAFDACVNNLSDNNLIPLLNDEVLINKKPILGICVGMQLMATHSLENGKHNGLNWIPGIVAPIDADTNHPVPHVGWNTINVINNNPVFNRLSQDNHFYFDHSFYFQPSDKLSIAANVDYGLPLTAAIQKEHIMGVQFHPEKSQNNGLKFFRNFITQLENYA